MLLHCFDGVKTHRNRVDFENRFRHNNVPFVGIPEGKEERDVVKFLRKLIWELLEIEGEREIERAHRTTCKQPGAGDRPTIILARFLRSLDRDLGPHL